MNMAETDIQKMASNNPSETGQGERGPKFEDFVSADFLRMVSEASRPKAAKGKGFTFREDRSLPPSQIGYTRKDTWEIRYNPIILTGENPWGRKEIEGFTYHEAGHHAPEVLDLDNLLVRDMKDPNVIPPSYRGNEQYEQRFLASLYRHLNNGLLDMWLEAYMGRRPYFAIGDSIRNMYETMGLQMPTYKNFSKPEQWMQAMLRERYEKQENLKDKVDPDVMQSFKRVYDTGAMKALLDVEAYTNYFASPGEKERALNRKFRAYKEVFLPEYQRLVENEIEERKQEKSDQKSKQKGAGKGDGNGGSGGSDAVPLTKQEEQEILEQFLKELEGAGEEHSQAPDPERQKEIEKFFKDLSKEIKDRIKNGAKQQESQQNQDTDPKGMEALEKRARDFQRSAKDKATRGMAEAMGVKPESINTWENIKQSRRQEIETTAVALAEFFLDDRRKKLELLVREGDIVPGLEYETISALFSGDLDPSTKMRTVRNPEFLETELEFVVDDSGSMGGMPIEKSVETLVVIAEAFKKVREDLAAEDLLLEDEQPFRIGVTKFDVSPTRVTKLDEPISDAKEIKIIDNISATGGGTDEEEALRNVARELSIGKHNAIKIMIVFSDGAGNREAVVPIIQQIEHDDEIVFLAIGIGEHAQGVVDTYLEPLRKGPDQTNVFGVIANDPREILPSAIEFLRREVEKRRQG